MKDREEREKGVTERGIKRSRKTYRVVEREKRDREKGKKKVKID